ncbi:uncharacterized protein LOC122508808 [Leptopilina heterotoma]|uniref:uncharacterized protein LOC122508808 n=1 Tax=Leptopilina heterotoma TaxID=63436 RepID=UPI001CA9D97C|nr:uncharacterized protein LOC122508808 [Leptopilina heterotoma]
MGFGVNSKRLHIRDRKSGLLFLIDTGSDVSLLPIQSNSRLRPTDIFLYAANDSKIPTFGEKRLSLDIGLRRDINWNFCLAAVPYPIIRPDLLANNNILVDLARRKLIDSVTSLTRDCENAGATFQRYVSRALDGLDYVFAYIDDLLIASSSPVEHEQHLNEVLSRLRDFGLRINIEKCEFGQSQLEFLGHMIDHQGIRPTEEKV